MYVELLTIDNLDLILELSFLLATFLSRKSRKTGNFVAEIFSPFFFGIFFFGFGCVILYDQKSNFYITFDMSFLLLTFLS